MSLEPTPMQTVGPYFSLGMMREKGDNVLVQPGTEGERIRIEGHVYDGDGDPLFNVLLEIWQANSHGRYNHPRDQRPLPLDPAFTGFGRASTDAKGHYWFQTVKPGVVPYYGGDAMLAPHIVVTVFASGVAYPLITRLYFADDPRNDDDPILQRVPEHRRHTLLAHPEKRDGGEGETVYRYDIVLRGEAEELVLEGKVAAEDAKDAPSGAGKAETVFLALR
jgi:protocatechuate 3,4-dioxygenase, alpha subunit